MTTVALTLLTGPGLYRLGLFDNQQQRVVAIGKAAPRFLHVGDVWTVADGDEPAMLVVAPFGFDDATPARYSYCLVPAEALEVSLPRPVLDLDAELRALLDRRAD